MATWTVIYDRLGKNPAYFKDGQVATAEEFAAGCPAKWRDDAGGAPGGHGASCWPMTSMALAVHPEQVAEANARNAASGCAAYYRPDGMCVIPDRKERSKLLTIEGKVDYHAGYGDTNTIDRKS